MLPSTRLITDGFPRRETHAPQFTVFLESRHTLYCLQFSLSLDTRLGTSGFPCRRAHARRLASPLVFLHMLSAMRFFLSGIHMFQIRRRLLLDKHTLNSRQFPLRYHTRWAIYSFCLHAHAQSSAGFLSSWRTLISGQFSLWRYTRLYTRRLPLLLLHTLRLKRIFLMYSTRFQRCSCFRQVVHALQGAVFLAISHTLNH